MVDLASHILPVIDLSTKGVEPMGNVGLNMLSIKPVFQPQKVFVALEFYINPRLCGSWQSLVFQLCYHSAARLSCDIRKLRFPYQCKKNRQLKIDCSRTHLDTSACCRTIASCLNKRYTSLVQVTLCSNKYILRLNIKSRQGESFKFN